MISAFFFPRFRVFIGLYSKARKRKRGNSSFKSRLPGASFIPKNKRCLCLLIPFYLVLSEDYTFRDFCGFCVFYLANCEYQKAMVQTSNLECCEKDRSISKEQAIQIFPTAHGASSESSGMTNLSRKLPGITSSSFASV